MNTLGKNNRREFIQKFGAASLGLSFFPSKKEGLKNAQELPWDFPQKNKETFSPNDHIQLATIGLGIQGHYDTRAALKNAGVKLVAGCDLYEGRLEGAKEIFETDLFCTRDYREILEREDIDAVIIATSDHWHQKIAIDALKAGKAVYCEKPMVQRIEEGADLIEAWRQSGKVLQVGSQRVSSIVYAKAGELFRSGAIGSLVLAEISNDRHSAIGAWNYSIPTDASLETVDWDRFLGHAPQRSFDATRFFRWRNYQDYGTGVPGDMFVHFFSGLHVMTGSLGPSRIYATGGLRYWNDGRDVPDIVMGSFDYAETPNLPEFNVAMRVNFADGAGGGSVFRLVGTEGVMEISGGGVKLKRNPLPEAPGFGGYDSVFTWDKARQKDFEEAYRIKYPSRPIIQEPALAEYKAPQGYSEHIDHFWNFFDAMRNDGKVVEDPEFGMRAAGPALASSISAQEKRIVGWNPQTIELLK